MEVISPLTKNTEIKSINKIPVPTLVQKYQEELKLDIGTFVQGLETIELFECKKTGYQFFYPFNLDGDGQFYEKLERFDWYYLPWKWEHQQTLTLIKPGQSVLEVGCGPASFVAHLQKEGYEAVGLELNEHCVNQAQAEGLDVKLELVQDHANTNPNKYDLVCSFQVLEHIADVNSFLQASITCLKPGGKLVVCVPNNGSFIKDEKWNVLNMTPHHMGLWKEDSLRKLENCFKIKTEEIRFEPLEPRHFHWYRKVWESKYLPKEGSIFYKIYHKMGLYKLIDKWIKNHHQTIHGHSILAIYQKLD
ncbi:MAG: class I SAM-dependent methyltransferase [Bacteroidota bacterium]